LKIERRDRERDDDVDVHGAVLLLEQGEEFGL